MVTCNASTAAANSLIYSSVNYHTRTQGGATHLIKLLKLRPPVAAVPRHVRQALARGGGGGPLHQELHKPVGEEQSWTMELDLGC